jgi:hypothetical protein
MVRKWSTVPISLSYTTLSSQCENWLVLELTFTERVWGAGGGCSVGLMCSALSAAALLGRGVLWRGEGLVADSDAPMSGPQGALYVHVGCQLTLGCMHLLGVLWCNGLMASMLMVRSRRESGAGGLTREVETPLPSNSPHGHMILRVDLVGSHGRWKRPCQTAPLRPYDAIAVEYCTLLLLTVP